MDTDNVDRSRQLYRGRKGVIHELPCAKLGKTKLHVVSQMHTTIITLLELAPKQAAVPRPQGPTS